MEIKVKLVDGGKMPEYKTAGAACADCYARLITPFITIPKKSRVLVALGFCIELPKGYEAVIRPRSGMTKKGIDIALGTIDWDYRNEVMCQLINNSDGDFDIKNLDRICQMKIQKAEQFEFVQVDELSETDRKGGFGSTGV
ncbi:MAG: dUTP diphosphatase [Treponema sp.]|nr:dUTP diphosphatase [Treponema sp.]